MPTAPAVEHFVESFQPKVLQEQQKGSVWEVVLIETGPSLNGKFYSRETLQDAVNRGVFNNIKAAEYFFGDKNDHIPSEASAVLPGGFRGNQVGWFENIRYGTTVDSKGQKVEGVLARFHIFKSASKLKSDMLELFEAGKPEMLGFSIDAKGLLQRASIGGRPIANVTKIKKVNETTVVNEPAAGGRALRLVASVGSEAEELAKIPEILETVKKFGSAWTEGIESQKSGETAIDHLSRVLQINLARAENELSRTNQADDPEGFKGVTRGVEALTEAVKLVTVKQFSGILDLCAARKRAYHLGERTRQGRRMDYSWPEFGDIQEATKLGDFLKSESEKKGISPERLAQRAGISVSTVGQIMRGEIQRPPNRRLQGFARALGVSLETLQNLIPENIRETVDMEEDPMSKPAGADLSYEELEVKLKEAEAKGDALEFKQKLKGLIDGTDLPDAAKSRLFQLLSDRADMSDEDVNEAIKAEREYLAIVAPKKDPEHTPEPTKVAEVVEGPVGEPSPASVDSGGKPTGLADSHDDPTANVTVQQESYDKYVKAFEGMFQEGRDVDGVRAFNSLHRAWYEINGVYHPPEIMADFLMEAIVKAMPGRETVSFEKHIAKNRALGTAIYSEELRESIDSSTFTTAFSDAMEKSLQREYTQDPNSDWRDIVSRRMSLRDLTNNHKVSRIGGYGILPIVNEKAPYQPLGVTTEVKEELDANKRGGTEEVSWEAMLADDLGVIAQIPRKFARSANRTVQRIVWDEIESNPVMADGNALISAAHLNRLSGDGAISGDNLATLIEQLCEQQEQDSDELLGLMPWRVFTGPRLFQEAWELTESEAKDVTLKNATTLNFIKGQKVTAMKTIALGRSAGTLNHYYLAANPRDAESIVVGFLGGRERPEIFVQSPTGSTATQGQAFDADIMTFKIRFGVGAKVIDWRWIQGSLTP